MSDDDLWLFKSYADQDHVEAVTDVLERGTWWASGPEIDAFEDAVADRTDREHAVAVNSGTVALYATLRALDVAGGEVIVPSFTFPATANAAVAAGADPVFADVERESLALDPADVERKLSPDTRAVVPIHFAGDVSAEIRALRDLADDHGVPLVEDAAHSLGATLDGDPAGSFGTAATFSFAFNKLLATGEGGMVVTDSDDLARDVELLRGQGRTDGREYVTYGLNFHMSSMTAAIGVTQAEKLDWQIARRREMADHLTRRLADLDGVHCPTFPDERDSVYQLYNVVLDDPARRDPLRDHLDDRGIPTRVTYEPVHLTTYYREEWGWSSGDLPVTEDVSRRIVTLPFHLDLDEDDLDRIADGVRSFFEG